MIYLPTFQTFKDFIMFEPEITPEIITACTKESSKGLIACLDEKKEKAENGSISALMDTLKIIVLEIDSASYEKFRPELNAILKKRTNNHHQAVIDYCDEIVKLLHLTYNETHPLQQRLIKDFKGRLATQFAPWNFSDNSSKLEDKYVDKIPWNDVFKSLSEQIRDRIVSMIDNYQDEEAKFYGISGDPNDGINKIFKKRAATLMNLKEKIKKDQESSNI